jgi:two-component system LytT family response regulator
MTIRAIIVDDEELARRGLEIRLRDQADIEIVAHCANGRTALAAID